MSRSIGETKLREWMRKLGPRLINLSAGICRDHHQAEEIVQEAFVKLWRRPPDAGEVAFASWLRRVVVNLSINALQRGRRPASLPENSTDPGLRSRQDADARREHGESLANVRAAMGRIDESKRAILMLRAYEQLSYDAIAAHLGVPIGTVMSRLNRARAALAEEMKREHRETETVVFDIRKYRRA